MKYLGLRDTPASEVQAELLEFLEQVQPGWRGHVITQRFLPRMTVTASLPQAKTGGLAGRPDVVVPDMPNVFICGDWVGPEGMLADAAVSSAQEAAQRAAALISSPHVHRMENAVC
jgi:phytoene dehydrogenase-like protein